MSRCLADRSIDHVVLERGEVAHSWRTQRWDSLRLLTPNWMTRLPGYAYRGDDPDGYLAGIRGRATDRGLRQGTAAPVRANTTVTSVRQDERGYVVQTDQDSWHARSVVLASGASTVANVPALQPACPPGSPRSPRRTTATRASFPTAGFSSSAPRQAGSRSPRSCTAPGGPSRSPSGSTSGCRAPIEARTSCGGWTRRDCSTSATTRSPTSAGPATCRRCSWSAHPSGAPSTSIR